MFRCYLDYVWIRASVGEDLKFMRGAKRESVEGHLILYAVLNSGIVPTSHTCIRDSFLANSLETPSRQRSERGAATGREILSTNGFAQSLAFSSSFSANSYPTRNLQLRMLRTYGDANIIISIHIAAK